MRAIYTLSIHIYNFLIHIASLKSNKAKLWLEGRESIFEKIKKGVNTDKPIYWFHAASLGEFEQGRTVIEKLKKTQDCFILLTFFSPSGYEVQKNNKIADFVCYLPIDTRKNAKEFVHIIKPHAAIFIKYEFWFNYLSELKKQKVNTFLISGIFRPKQHFFKFYGTWFKNQLVAFEYFFLQNQESQSLLKGIGFSNATVSGDTRFDRVFELSNEAFDEIRIDSFSKESKVIVAGSTWDKEHEFISKFVNSEDSNYKFIIAPHEINQNNIQSLKKEFGNKCILFSETIESQDLREFNCLIIDSIGLLSKLYRFAYVTIIGGGFGSGIHNTLEAAAYGTPIIFGPNYQKFQEAKDLISNEAAIHFSSYEAFKSLLLEFQNNLTKRDKYGQNAKKYVHSNIGATDLIMKKI